MKEVVYLVCTQAGVSRVVKKLPALAPEEVAISLEVSVPDSAFKRVIPKAVLHIEDEQILRPPIEVRVTADTIEDGVRSR